MESNQERKSSLGTQESGNSKLSVEPETHLQSLGFTMNNGKARFILDDDTPLYSNAALTNFSVVDPNETLSFVVLGKDSMDSIQASSLASYVDIQQKSMSVDYNSMIASWNSNEVHQKLNELLQENGKLKETLKQNNVAMRQQFNTLASWQEEMMKVHHNHKKKFTETRELMNYLKKENTDLKMKLSVGGNIIESGYEALNANEINSSVEENGSSLTATDLQEKVSSLTEQLSNSKQKCEKLSSDVDKLHSISILMSSQLKQATSTIQEQRLNIKKLEVQAAMSKSYDSNYFNQSIKSDSPRHSKNINTCTNCENYLTRDKEINLLKESVTTLEHKLEHATAPVQFCIKSPINPKKYRQQHIQRLGECKEKLQELTVYFDKQIDRCAIIEKCLQEVIETFETAESLNDCCPQTQNSDYILIHLSSNFDYIKDQLASCHKRIVVERQKLIEDNERALVTQNQFQKTLLDCNSILYELETALRVKVENTMKANTTTESVQKATESMEQDAKNKQVLQEELKSLAKEKEGLEDKKRLLSIEREDVETEFKNLNTTEEVLQHERISLLDEKSVQKTSESMEQDAKTKKVLEEELNYLAKEKERLEEQNQIISTQKKNLEIEFKNLNTAKEILQQERISLLAEKSSLDQQSQLYESHYKETLEAERQKFEVKYNQLVTEIGSLHETIQRKELCVINLQTEIEQHRESINLLQTQLQLFEEDFTQERELKNLLMQEKSQLCNDIQQQIDFNRKLQQELCNLKFQYVPAGQSENSDLVPPLMSTLRCPKCDEKFRNIESLEEHISMCLSLLN
ncbi:PREDICTED: centrosome-associated protein CEP250-like [Dufourea novaeangliae]|uniref:centrosome-associated protein CEP250-like n=1 Tax=Dufourea novaeangliae TaxID=178035 RepID=UPI0007675B53|nr:PREDICTED: centrosome-associated protein CEP250-like [Dufourea novaeangliae]